MGKSGLHNSEDGLLNRSYQRGSTYCRDLGVEGLWCCRLGDVSEE